MPNISKSKYCLGVQCPKLLWLKINKPELFDDSVMNQAVLDAGSAVGDLAMGLFGDFVEVTAQKEDGSLDFAAMLRRTQEELARGTENVCEATFSREGLFCSVDILRNLGGGEVEVYEVKSSTEVKEIYLHDLSFQVYVLRRCGFTVKKACIVHINNQYVRHGEIDLHELFKIVEHTRTAELMQDEVAQRLSSLRRYLAETEVPFVQIGLQCEELYKCGYWGYCTCDLPQPNVFSLRGLQIHKDKKYELFYNGFSTFEELRECEALKLPQRIQVECGLSGEAHIEPEPIRDFLRDLTYPLYFLDFETFQSAVPPYDGMKPYQQIPFQYSLHWIEREGGELHHAEFLAQPDGDPRRALAERLCADIPLDVCTTAYNKKFECARLKELADAYPDLAFHLLNIREHIVDLDVPFDKKWYYLPSMEGSYSIKYVLPALYPNDPALDYHNLEGVHHGGEAMEAFKIMGDLSPEAQQTLREQLLRYCELDTYAMVKVWEKLREV